MSTAQHAEILAVIRSRVRPRFALTVEQLADFVVERGREAGADRDLPAYVRQLNLDDLYLARACALRDERAWAECERSHFGFMREFASRFLRGADAADVTSQVIADLWEKGKLARYEGRSSLKTWLGAVVAHAALQAGKVVRRHQAYAQRDADAPPAAVPAPAPEDDGASQLLADITVEAIQALTDDQKLLLLLHYEQGLSLEEIVPILAMSKATLSRRLKRVREQIKSTIEEVARHRYRSSGDEVRGRVDLARIELDLSALLNGIGPVKGSGGKGV